METSHKWLVAWYVYCARDEAESEKWCKFMNYVNEICQRQSHGQGTDGSIRLPVGYPTKHENKQKIKYFEPLLTH